MTSNLVKFKIVGVFTSENFQKCKYYGECIHRNLPDIYAAPSYRCMLDVQWTEFLTKFRRNVGGKLWQLKVPVAVFKNGVYFGSDEDFVIYCSRIYSFRTYENFLKCGERQLHDFIINSERIYAYFMISIDEQVIGTLLFELFTDLVPLTCANFMRLCNKKSRGYKNSPVHRIAKSSWVQFGGYDLKKHRMPCENYYVHHDQRGILSMCNSGKHRGNNTQFFVTLDKTPWMDYYYVAFGQLLHGENVLRKIEAIETKYESPEVPIMIEDCGEYTFERIPDQKFLKDYEEYLHGNKDKFTSTEQEESPHIGDALDEPPILINYPDDISDFRDVDSNFSDNRYQKGLYCIETLRKCKTRK